MLGLGAMSPGAGSILNRFTQLSQARFSKIWLWKPWRRYFISCILRHKHCFHISLLPKLECFMTVNSYGFNWQCFPLEVTFGVWCYWLSLVFALSISCHLSTTCPPICLSEFENLFKAYILVYMKINTCSQIKFQDICLIWAHEY